MKCYSDRTRKAQKGSGANKTTLRNQKFSNQHRSSCFRSFLMLIVAVVWLHTFIYLYKAWTMDAQWSRFSLKSRSFGLGQTNWADKFWDIWDIFSQTILWIKTKDLNKCPFYDHFWPFFHQLYFYLSQKWGSDGHFEVPNGSKSWLVQKLWPQM